MPELSPRQLRWLRDEIGDKPDDAELHERYDQLRSVRDVAMAVLRKRRADLISRPMSVTVTGVAGTGTAENVRAIERQLNALALMDDDPSDDAGGGQGDQANDHLQVLHLERPRRR